MYFVFKMVNKYKKGAPKKVKTLSNLDVLYVEHMREIEFLRISHVFFPFLFFVPVFKTQMTHKSLFVTFKRLN